MADFDFDRLMKALKEKTKEVEESPEEAKRMLVDSGIYTTDGKLTDVYRSFLSNKRC